MKIGVSKKPRPLVAVSPHDRQERLLCQILKMPSGRFLSLHMTASQEFNYLSQLTELLNNDHLMQVLDLRDHEKVVNTLEKGGLSVEDVYLVLNYYFDKRCKAGQGRSFSEREQLYWSCVSSTLHHLEGVGRSDVVARAERYFSGLESDEADWD